ncbi:MAG: 16S rRNA (cytosine(1402)-N(4))-methyltransferase, partial [Candidatus Paceibacterota bacterium]
MRTRRSQSSGDPMSQGHRTVLLHEAVDSLDIQKNDVVVDGTLGGAGHSVEILKHLGTHGTLIGFDADKEAIERSKIALEGAKAAVHFVNTNFRHLKTELETRGLGRIDKALFDLGWSSYQLDAGRGFSFQKDEPLSMAYAADQALDAFEIVNQWGEQSIAD